MVEAYTPIELPTVRITFRLVLMARVACEDQVLPKLAFVENVYH
jgi:hypothetical protein